MGGMPTIAGNGPLPHGPHKRILSQDQPGTQMGPSQHAPRNRMSLSLVGIKQPGAA